MPKINLLDYHPENQRKKKLKTLIKILSAFVVVSVLLFFLASFIVSFALPGDGKEQPSMIERLTTLLPSSERKLIGEKDNRINMLILGMGGAGHEGPYLTDTVILASFKPKEKKAILLSIPRDLVVPVLDQGWRKINHINAYAEIENAGSGGDEARKILSDVFDIPIPYYARADFAGFKQIIDDLGGITVNVERAFTDSMFPTSDFKTTTVSFPEGWQIMDGEKSLQFVRSRHGSNNEGTDFARSKRQQKVILAIKNKVFSVGVMLSPLRLIGAIQTTKENIDTNFEVWEIIRAANLVKDMSSDDIVTYVLDDSEDGLLRADYYEGAYVLLPKGGWAELKSFVKNIFWGSATEKIAQNKLKEVRVEVQNGTKINGLAAAAAEKLGNAGLNVIFYGNAPKQDFEKTIIFNLTDKDPEGEQAPYGASKKDVLEKISELLGGQIFNKDELPDNINPAARMQGADLLIILGSDQEL